MDGTKRTHSKNADGMTISKGHDKIVEKALLGESCTLEKHDGHAASVTGH